jgi:tRNA(Ile)-lysidine synthase
MYYKNFVDSVESLGPYENNPEIVVGVSGGIDSLALVFLVNDWLRSVNGKVIALTVNHNLRKEAFDEALSVQKLLLKNGIEHHILDWHHDKILTNIQEKARRARLELLTDWCNKNNILHLMLAQHSQDQAETMLMKICRGSGLNGLTGMPAVNIVNKVRVIRPLLSFSKSQLKSILSSYVNWWIEDPSNDNPKFMRTAARRLLNSITLLKLVNVKSHKKENLIQRMNLLAENLTRVRSYLEQEAARHMVMMVKIFSNGYLVIDYQSFSKINKEMGLTVLSACLITVSNEHLVRPRLASLERIWNSISHLESKSFTLWKCQIKLSVSKNIIEILPELNIGKKFIPLMPLAQKQFDC